MIDNVFELTNLERSGVLDVTVDGTSVVHSGNVAEVPAIDNVTQTDTSTDADYRVLLSNSANSTTETAGVGKSNGLLYNPSAKQLIVRNPNFSTYMTMTEPNIGIYQKSNPNGYWGGMRITARDITLEGKISDGSNINQTWDGVNTSLKSAISSLRTDMDSTTLSGTSEPASSDGRENSLYVKYNTDEVIIPTGSPRTGTVNQLSADLSEYTKVHVVIDTSIDPRYSNYQYDEILDTSNPTAEIAVYDEDLEDYVRLGIINFQFSTYTTTSIRQTLTIYNAAASDIDDIYFKKDNAWIKDKKNDYIVVEGSFDNVGAGETASDVFSAQDLETLGFDTSDILKYQCISMARGINVNGASDITQWYYQGTIFEDIIYPTCYINSDNGIIEMRITCVNHNSLGTAKLFYRAVFMKVAD